MTMVREYNLSTGSVETLLATGDNDRAVAFADAIARHANSEHVVYVETEEPQ